MTKQINSDQRNELIEQVVEEHCDEKCISGEKVWTFIYALAEEKLEEFPIDCED